MNTKIRGLALLAVIFGGLGILIKLYPPHDLWYLVAVIGWGWWVVYWMLLHPAKESYKISLEEELQRR